MDLDIQRDHLNVRCPECFKLFAVRTADVHDPKPKFQCTSCQQRFWIPFADALREEMVVGFPISEPASLTSQSGASPMSTESPTHELITKPYRCPICSTAYAAGDEECTKCGLLFAKFIEKSTDATPSFGTTPEIRECWSDVVDKYEDYATHQRFIAQCLAEKNLDLALQKYSDILAVNPNDELARKAMNEIKSISIARWEAQTGTPKSSPFNFRIPNIRLGSIAMVIAGFLIVVGIMVPQLRNLVGFGTAMLFSLMALRFYLRIL